MPSKRVSFDTVTISEFPTTLGHNPSRSTGGPPISIGWEQHRSKNSVQLELYEHCRSDKRRRGASLIITSAARLCMLRDAGFSPLEIARSTVDADLVLRQRHESNESYVSERRTKSSPRTTQRKNIKKQETVSASPVDKTARKLMFGSSAAGLLKSFSKMVSKPLQ